VRKASKATLFSHGNGHCDNPGCFSDLTPIVSSWDVRQRWGRDARKAEGSEGIACFATADNTFRHYIHSREINGSVSV
jgi:hypothetical protein